MVKEVFLYALRFAIAPRRAADDISADPAGVWAALWWSLLSLLAYAVTVLVYWLLHHEPVTAGWLTIARKDWYLLQTFTTVPVGLAGFISYAGLMFFLCKAIGGKGGFEATFAAQIYCVTVPCVVFMLLLELLVAPVAIALGMKGVPWPAWVELLRTFVLPFAWIFVLSSLAMRRVHGTHPLAGIGFTAIALVPTGIIMAVFIR
jgi:hypothetical protein